LRGVGRGIGTGRRAQRFLWWLRKQNSVYRETMASVPFDRARVGENLHVIHLAVTTS
jgi:hypothetical protein